MGECRNDYYDREKAECCEKECMRDCKDKCFQECYCDNGSNGFGILILLIVLYFLFCNNGKGGPFGGLF